MRLNRAAAKFLSGYFSTHERSQKTKAAYRTDLEQFRAFVGRDSALRSLSGSVIESWATDLKEKGYSPASIRRKMIALKVFCSYWIRQGALSESPFWRVKLSYGRIEQLPRTLTEREMKALLAQARRNHMSIVSSRNGSRLSETTIVQASSHRYRTIRNLALIDILFATGMRVGEVSSLDLPDFTKEDGVLRVQGKGGRDRLAFLADEQTIRIQREHAKARAKIDTATSALFLNSAAGRLSTQGIANIIAQVRKQAGIERHVTPHMLRHTVATLLLRNGVDIRVVQEFLGHTSIATTQRYTHVSKEHLLKVLRKRHPSLGMRAKR